MSEGTQRRLTTIVAADIAGFSRLVGIDEEATLTAQRNHRTELIEPLLVEHNGRIANTAGDSFLFEFPSAVEAVRCAIALQEGIAVRNRDIPADQRIEYRIGINVGDVVADGGDLLGDCVNIAARLEGICQPGTIILSDDAYRQVRDRLEITWEDGGLHEVKNIARPLQVWRWGLTAKAITARSVETPFALLEKPSIAVLPFDNMSGDPEQDFFADGLCEDLIMALSQYPGLLVIARNSTFVYKGRAMNIAAIARDLNVGYVLEGSVRCAGQRIRITAQLIDTGSGAHVWAERYDRDLGDIFAVQDEITLNIVSALGQKLSEGEYATVSRKGTASLEAWRSVVQAMETYKDVSESGVESTLEHLREAVRIDPEYAFALGMMAFMYIYRIRYGWSRDEQADLERVFDIADKSNEIAPDLPLAYCARGFALSFQRDYEAGVRELRRATEVAPSNSYAKFVLGGVLNFCGGHEEAILLLEEARRLDPFHGPWVLGVLAHSLRLAGRYEEALTTIGEHQDIRPASAHDDRIITLFEMGRKAEAMEAAQKLLQFHPSFRTEEWAKRQYYQDPEQLNRDLEALRSAGLK